MSLPERKKPGRKVVAGVVLGVLTIVAAWSITVSPLFRLETLTVEGQRQLSRERIIKLAQLVPEETNVLWLSGSTVADRIEAEPWVERADVTKDLPSTLSIDVTERRPAVMSGERGAWMVVASDGVVLEILKAEPDLPLVEGIPATQPGSRVDAAHIAAAEAGGYLGDRGVAPEIATIMMDPAGEMRLVLEEGGKVTAGEPVDLEAKMEALAGIVKWAEENRSKIRSVDVTAPGAPAAKVSRGTPPAEG